MNVPATTPTKSLRLPCSRGTTLVFSALVTVLALIFSSASTAAPQSSTLVTLAKIREDWVQALRTK
jgi:hypothetical protein